MRYLKYWPIRDQYSGHVTCIDQSEASIYLHTALLLVPRMSCERWSRNTASTLRMRRLVRIISWLRLEELDLLGLGLGNFIICRQTLTCYTSPAQTGCPLHPDLFGVWSLRDESREQTFIIINKYFKNIIIFTWYLNFDLNISVFSDCLMLGQVIFSKAW